MEFYAARWEDQQLIISALGLSAGPSLSLTAASAGGGLQEPLSPGAILKLPGQTGAVPVPF